MTIVVAPGSLFQPGSSVAENVYGDTAATLRGSAASQTFIYFSDGASARGDALEMLGTAIGGRDRFEVTGTGTVYGDAISMGDASRGGNDTLNGAGPAGGIGGPFSLYGDAFFMSGRSLGGNDSFSLTGAASAVGDASEMSDSARGGSDRIVYRGADSFVTLAGDAVSMQGFARGGNDTITANGDGQTITGDTIFQFGSAVAGNDRITVNGAVDSVLGDAFTLGGSNGSSAPSDARGGADRLVSRYASGSEMAGDAYEIVSNARGGNDTLLGGDGDDRLTGDAVSMRGASSAGNDVLDGGKGDDTLFGDAQSFDSTGQRGADRFAFGFDSGSDIIGDFTTGQDRIDVSALGITSTAGFDAYGDDGTDTTIVFSAGNQVVVEGVLVSQLTAADFIFA